MLANIKSWQDRIKPNMTILNIPNSSVLNQHKLKGSVAHLNKAWNPQLKISELFEQQSKKNKHNYSLNPNSIQ